MYAKRTEFVSSRSSKTMLCPEEEVILLGGIIRR